MARINTNIPSNVARVNLNRAYADLNLRLQRLSTGLRINRGADDPAGLITSERLRSEMGGIRTAIDNSERAASVIATSEGALSEISDLLTSIKGLIVQAANTGGMSPEEIAANQLQIDSAIDSITRISNTANFAGLQLLNGSLDYLMSGVDESKIMKTRIKSANFGTATNIAVDVQVLGSAQVAQLALTADYTASSNFDGTIGSSIALEISGNEGVMVLEFGEGTKLSTVARAINAVRDSTGISASLKDISSPTSGILFSSTTFGRDSFVSVKRIGDSGTDSFDSRISSNYDIGEDVTALVNGILATGRGIQLDIRTPTLSVELLLDEAFAQQTNSQTTFYITGGGAKFQLGPQVKTNQQISFSLRSVAASRIGGSVVDGELQFLNSIQAGGSNSLDTENFEDASRILETAIDEIALQRGELGAIERNTIQTNIRSLQVSLENITASESKIRDADFAVETAALTRAQILVQAGTSVLATANTTAQSVLQLLG